ncbi:MAG: hypothetical protein ABIS26_00520 [Candidatus Paceibacterota bacterium]
MLDRKKLKDKLEKERDTLVEELRGMGKFNPEAKKWEATPQEQAFPETDPNAMADRFEDFEARSSMIKTLEPRLKDILKALKKLGSDAYGKCKICKKDIEMARLYANPAAGTCKKHLEK